MKQSPLQSEQERLKEKLQRMADKRGADSPHAEELARQQHPEEGVTPQKRATRVTEDVTKDK